MLSEVVVWMLVLLTHGRRVIAECSTARWQLLMVFSNKLLPPARIEIHVSACLQKSRR